MYQVGFSVLVVIAAEHTVSTLLRLRKGKHDERHGRFQLQQREAERAAGLRGGLVHVPAYNRRSRAVRAQQQ